VRYWWVNHKQTVRQEIQGEYLWSPKRKKNGNRNRFYDTMREASTGDRVLSYANGKVGHVGTVKSPAHEADKPDEFGTAGENWNNLGWRLPVAWSPLPSPVRPKPIIEMLRPLLPQKYSPLSGKTGNGNQGTYLAEIDQDLFEYLVQLGGGAINRADRRRERRQSRVAQGQSPFYGPPGETERLQNTKVRIGQGLFRTRVLEFGRACRLTGVEDPRLLVASHIKPWRDSTPEERVDGANGLLLAPHVDRLFDRGLISFEDNGSVKFSPRVSAKDLERLGLAEASTRLMPAFDKRQCTYLAHHRDRVFLKK
jgi:hypothetical protein